MNFKKSVVIIDNDPVVVTSLKTGVNSTDRYICAATFSSAEEFLHSDVYPYIILFEVFMDGVSGLDVIGHMLDRQPNVHVLINSVKEDPEIVLQAIRNGANGFTDKQSIDHKLDLVLNSIDTDGVFISPFITRKLFNYFQKSKIDIESLSEIERRITDMILNGSSYKMVAKQLGVSIDTVRMHIKRIYRKLKINSKSQLFNLKKSLSY